MKKLIFLFFIQLFAVPVLATTFYVAQSGGDNNRSCATAQTLATPKATINSGVSCLSAGDTLIVRGGTYNENLTYIPSGTSWNNKVRIANYPGETVWMAPVTGNDGTHIIWLDCNCSYIEIDGINMDGRACMVNCPEGQGALWISTNNGNQPHHVRFKNAEVINVGSQNGVLTGSHSFPGQIGSSEFQNLYIHGGGRPGECGFGCASYAIYVNSPNNLIENCELYDTSGAFVQIYSKLGEANGNIVRNNRMHDLSRTGDPSEVWGIVITGANNIIYNNLIYNITKYGQQYVGDAAIALTNTGNKIWNNTIYNVANAGITVSLDAGGNPATNNEIRNNIVYITGTPAYYGDGGIGTIQDHNLFGINPLFVSTGSANFKLQSGSPARNTGITVSTVTTDLVSIPRPQESVFDIGAYEFVAGSPIGPPSTPTGLHVIP